MDGLIADGDIKTPLEMFRDEKDQFFKKDPNSPLTEDQRIKFTKLNYFPENDKLRMELEMEMIDPPVHVILTTSTGEQRDYLHKGCIHFQVNNHDAELQVYTDGYGGYFIPFTDGTAPMETYGGGRYLEPEEISEGVLLVDFNLAYNPFCAYNDRWSCPIPPVENRIKVRIEAGEKNFK
ncbi:MAG: DUF1684 domain-containing protein [Anaerolineales bacterium]